MTTTDPDALTERIARAQSRCRTFEPDVCDGCQKRLDEAARVLPLIAAEVRKAKAEAWDEGHAACDHDWAFTADLSTPDEDREPWTNPYRATETRRSDERR